MMNDTIYGEVPEYTKPGQPDRTMQNDEISWVAARVDTKCNICPFQPPSTKDPSPGVLAAIGDHGKEVPVVEPVLGFCRRGFSCHKHDTCFKHAP